ncbi:hypothetical protein GCM10011611_65530 [Aliidongia dinghuensis]|uniref:Dienelactone hydrolase n=1 Tax=Aliidongia dinghuensis TaxID=1867774 RepID=A0A8J2Z0E0_9PROT|nr:dienelactone hydrolase [Aliidongia dinghuensis]GGF50023.1 hypothetical protein GCM10011611_65530 [Aliidongia dinghuensis]
MRSLIVGAILLSIVSARAALAEAPPFHAGAGVIPGSVDMPDGAIVRYPTFAAGAADAVSSNLSPPVADGRFPIVLLSHGGGPTGGSPVILAGLSAALAQHGFVVVAPFHGTARLPRRAAQVAQALEAALADPRFAPHMDAARLGMLGFSLGGAVTLELAGATPDGRHFHAYCEAHPADVMSCNHAPAGGGVGSDGQPPPPPRLALRAIALLDPFAALFQRDGLTGVTLPVLLVRPAASELPGDANALGLAAALPRAPDLETVPGGHFVFTDSCPSTARSGEPRCLDPPGVDRAAVQAQVEAQLLRFFGANL